MTMQRTSAKQRQEPRPKLPARTLDRRPLPAGSTRPQPRPRGTFPGVLSVPVKR